MTNKACGFPSLPRVWNTAGWVGTHRHLEPRGRFSGLTEGRHRAGGGEDQWFSGVWCCLPSSLAGHGWEHQGGPPTVACGAVRWSRGRRQFSGQTRGTRWNSPEVLKQHSRAPDLEAGTQSGAGLGLRLRVGASGTGTEQLGLDPAPAPSFLPPRFLL